MFDEERRISKPSEKKRSADNNLNGFYKKVKSFRRHNK